MKQIIVINPKTGQKMVSFLNRKNEFKKAVCSCNGKYTKASEANPFIYDAKERTLKCPECGKEIEIIQTPEEFEEEQKRKEEEINQKKLQNLHIALVGSDWECGFKYYGLSAQIEYNDWLKVKEYFSYYKRGWSRGQELEWDFGEPTGWLTRQPEEVEKVLVDAGLIEPENTMKAIEERKQKEREEKEAERQAKLKEKESKKAEMDELKKEIHDAFDSTEKRALSDAEATEHYFNPTFGKGTISTYTITDNEIIHAVNAGDYKTGVAIPYSEEIIALIKEYYKLNNWMWNYAKK